MPNDNVDLTWIMASAKAVSDRRAALGFQDVPHYRGGRHFERNVEGPGGGGGGLLLGLIVGSCWVMWKIGEVVIPVMLWLSWEILKLMGHALGALLSSGRR
jgi:hypothetical protein